MSGEKVEVLSQVDTKLKYVPIISHGVLSTDKNGNKLMVVAAANSGNYLFIQDILLHGELQFKYSQEAGAPYTLFKEMYTVLQTGTLTSISIESAFYSDSCDNDTTLIDGKTCVVNVLPKIVLVHGNNLNLLKVIRQKHHMATQTLKMFLNKKYRSTILDLQNILQAHVMSIFKDLLSKWFQWSLLINKNGGKYKHRNTHFKTLLKTLLRKFWNQYFFFKDSQHCSIDDFKWVLQYNNKKDNILEKISFGCWLDTTNKIVILGNNVKYNQDSFTASTAGICLTQETVVNTTNTLFLFVNMAIVHCFAVEVS